MKRFFTFACLGVAGVMMTSNALALDDFSTFYHEGLGNDVDPFELSCKQYNGLGRGARGGLLRLPRRPSRGGVKHGIRPGGRRKISRAAVSAVCAKNPGKALDGFLEEVQYDVPEGGSEPAVPILTA